MERRSSGGSKDAARHADDLRHHVQRSKDVRLDRHDGTGRGHEQAKKAGAGAGNWGLAVDRASEGTKAEEDLDLGPDAVSPRDFVHRTDVFTLDEFEKLKEAQVKA